MHRPWGADRYPFDDPDSPSPREAEIWVRSLIRAYEAVRDRPHTPECRAAYAALAAAAAQSPGGWVQAEGLRFIWSRGDAALIRTRVRGAFQQSMAPVKV